MAQRLPVEDLPGITTDINSDPPIPQEELQVLEEIQRRVLWLSTNIIHHANNVRENSDGSKVGGHQASSASVDPDSALLPPAPAGRPCLDQAARLAGVPRHPVPDGPAPE